MPVINRIELGKKVSQYRDAHMFTDRFWLQSFVLQEFGDENRYDACKLKRLKKSCRSASVAALKHSTGKGGDIGRSVRGHTRKDGARTNRVSFGQRHRIIGGGRHDILPELGAELFQYFIDRVQLKVRVPSGDLLGYAQQLLELAKKAHEAERAASPETPQVQFPNLNYVWLARWRKQHGLTFRTVNLVYKVSWPKACSRYGVLWRNCLRLRFFHEKLFGEGKLRFINIDQQHGKDQNPDLPRSAKGPGQ